MDIVSFENADLGSVPTKSTVLNIIDLSGDRSVGVGRLNGGPDFVLRFRTPTRDGKIAEMMFALTSEAALALLTLLSEAHS